MNSQLVNALHRHWTRNPNHAVALGVEQNLDRLPDPSLHDVHARSAEARGLIERLRSIDTGKLGFDERLDRELAELMLEAELHRDSYRWNGLTRLEQLPTAGDDIGDGIFQLFIRDPRPAGERLRDIRSRIEGIPAYLDALLRRLARPLARWVAMDLAKVAGLPQLFETMNDWADVERWPDAALLRQATARAEAALTSYSEALRGLGCHTQLHVGEATAERIVRLRGIDLSLAELHRIAGAFLARVQSEIEELRVRLVRKYQLPPGTSIEALEIELKRRFMVPLEGDDLEAIVRRYFVERDRILEFVRERELFPIFEEQEMKILRTPKFMEPSIPAGAMLSPAPFRAGTKTSVVYLTLSDELRAEHTELSIPAMMIHEGIPGHHLQLATAACHPSIVRRHVDAMDQAEGWTTMLEDYMLDVGYMGELTDEARFIGRRDISRIGARVGIDLFFMTGDRSYLELGVPCRVDHHDPFQAAASLLSAVTGFVPSRVHAELNWYSQERGYPLSYLTGNHLVWQLKRDVARHAQHSLSGYALDRTFHRVFLQAGNMPLSYLRRVFEQHDLLPPA